MNFRIITFVFSFLFSISLIQAQNSKYQTAKPQKGEGIHALLRRHSLDATKDYKTFLKINKDLLKGGTTLSHSQAYRLPKGSSKLSGGGSSSNYDALFGKEHASFTTIDNQLQNAVYYIVAGHGGPDPGAQGRRAGRTLSEDEYAYDIALRLSKELKKHGAIAYMIVRDPNDGIRDQKYLKSDKDERVWKNKKIPLNALSKLRQRTNAINKLYKKHKGKYQRLLVLHIDSRSRGKRIDIYGYHHSKSKSGKRFTNNLIKTLEQNYRKAQPGRGFSGVSKTRDNLYMVRKPYPPTCFLELGNIQNTEDQVRFIEPNNRQAIANWLTKGCIKDFKNRK